MGDTIDEGKSKSILSIASDKKEVGAQAAAFILSEADAAIKKNGKFTVAFSGGSLPKLVGPGLASAKPKNTDKWVVLFSDERCVSLESEDSNFLSVQQHVLNPLGIPKENVVTIDPNKVSDPDAAAIAYEEALRKATDVKTGVPSMDLVLLGMGPDGHTCSLFPKHPLLNANDPKQLIRSIKDSPKPPSSRITFTYPLLNQAKGVAFVCTGGSKSKSLKEVLDQQVKPEDKLPSARIENPRIFWFVDKDAAKDLKA
uniref:6-phosphogluconolactonase n=1 Tax=Lotharella globosa TaxID=91324 RepID=A0A7S3YSC8_9EUKA|eukprot:CAMPEP_0167790716 /NCGR_PEP_ID=MMETSP0111_2-20121227/11501_1 /TAXON_ID=91324 /ORGANISM="Lotharella globosa, Strain CCCM811" /LENGTH=255 /DNA_ID=CAMNT_0007683237 /DNA_START=53 /DNA_END=820 /DNA_ORIENTATION=-